MADVIQLLPDSIANQIAAGEVIQRPASVVKELLENSVDAGSTSIKLIIKDAGKTLIQVVDNGCGMSETDARMCFERHATSKIRTAKDLFALRTMGFRGEAMASIASIAQVELRTRQRMNELGTRIVIEGTVLKTQEPCQCIVGSSILVKNLFFNVPARRNFLKSNTVEMRHITDEFQRVALAHPDIFFSLHHNGTEVFHLPVSNLRQRVVNVLGSGTNKKLVPVKEETELVQIKGFISKPDYAKRTRGEQFFFVNNRFIKSGWLHHAVMGAFEDLLAQNMHPLYVIFVDIDPAHIDVNVHPTKQEIKFDDEKMVYNYLKVAIRHALGQYSVTPTLDFDQEPLFSNINFTPRASEESAATLRQFPSLDLPSEGTYKDKSENRGNKRTATFDAHAERQRNNLEQWELLYQEEALPKTAFSSDETPIVVSSKISKETSAFDDVNQSFSKQQKTPYQLHRRYIINQIKSGFWIIDQQAAHERILYEKYLRMMEGGTTATQRKLFPQTIHVSKSNALTLKDLLPEIQQMGFDIEEFGGNSFIVHGVPADFRQEAKEQEMIEQLIAQYHDNLSLDLGFNENIARSLAMGAAIKKGQHLNVEEMQMLIDELFACEMPLVSPRGKKCFLTFELSDLEKMFS